MADQDRRVRRTRRILFEALIGLVLEKGYERITVQDILDRADVGRSTFYAHFRDKDALLLTGFDDMRAELQRDVNAMVVGEPPAGPTQPMAAVFAHAHRHRRVYQALCGRQGGPVVIRHLSRVVADILRGHLRPHLSEADLPVEVVVQFYTSAAVGLLTWWIDQDFPYGPAALAAMYQRLGASGLLGALTAGPAATGRPEPAKRAAD